jgi:hypothetical protein
MTTAAEQLFTLLSALTYNAAPVLVAPEVMIQNEAYPYITYRRLANPTCNTLSGNGTPPIMNTHFEISSWALSYADAMNVAALVTAAMQGWTLQNVLLREQDMYESDVKAFRVIQDFSVWHYT